MKSNKYKLKKWYPSLPEDWQVGDTVEEQSGGIYPYKNSNEDRTAQYIRRNHVKDNPEYWEPIEEKEYEILTVKGNNTERIQNYRSYHRISDNKYDWSVHSVKRLADGEVFTIGDKIESIHNKITLVIASFDISEIWISGIGVMHESGFSYDLKNIKHTKNPIFTTEDGVDIYEGDKYFIVDNIKWDGVSEFKANERSGSVSHHIYFSTKEKAKECVDQHEPKYSKADIKEAIEKSALYKSGGDSALYKSQLYYLLDL